MVFNAVVSNVDDQPRNHAVVAMDTDWKLSPAYDLTPSTPISADYRYLALECGDMGRLANAGNLLSQCERFYLAPDDARNMIDRMEAAVRDNWHAVARREGVTAKDCEQIASAFAYAAFRREAEASWV